MSSLTLAQAQKVLDAGVTEIRRLGLHASIAVVDDRGDLVVAANVDDGLSFQPDVAYGKAAASALWQTPSRELVGTGGQNTVQQRANALNGGRLVFSPGAMPLLKDEVVFGAVGVEGAGVELDDEIASAAAKAFG